MPQVKLAYTYLVAWYVLHCLDLMTMTSSINASKAFVQNLVECSWTTSLLSTVREILSTPSNYQLYQCPPEFDGAIDGISFMDLAMDDGFTMLALGPFTWLLNIPPGYHVSRQGTECLIELHVPSHFAYQLIYD